MAAASPAGPEKLLCTRSDNHPVQVITSRRLGLKRLIYNRIRNFFFFLKGFSFFIFCFFVFLFLLSFIFVLFLFCLKRAKKRIKTLMKHIKKLTHSRFVNYVFLSLIRSLIGPSRANMLRCRSSWLARGDVSWPTRDAGTRCVPMIGQDWTHTELIIPVE